MCPTAPEGLCRIIHKLLAKKPEERFQRVVDLLRELRALQLDDAEIDEEWTTPEMFALADTRFEATQQLQTVMSDAAKERQVGRRRLMIAAAALAVAFFIGAVVAVRLRPRNLLASGVMPGAQVEKRDNPREQYLHAVLLPAEKREAALLSIRRYFPADSGAHDNQYYWTLAEQRLAELYIDDEDYDQARKHLVSLSNHSDAQFRAYGLVGLANDADRRGNQERALSYLHELFDMREDLLLNARDVTQRLSSELRVEYQRLSRETSKGENEDS